MKIDWGEAQKLLGQMGVAACIGGLLDGILTDGGFGALLLGGIGLLSFFLSVLRRS